MATKSREQEQNGSTAKGGSVGTLIGVAAGGFALGVAAMIGRKVAVQAPTLLAGDWDEALAAEHKATLLIFDAMEATDETNTTKRAILLAQLKHALGKHALEEENVIYPALREAGHVADADHLNEEHGYVKDYLYQLDNTPNDAPEYLDIVRKFRGDIEQHMREEESELFPRLKGELSDEKNKQLTQAMNKEGFKLA